VKRILLTHPFFTVNQAPGLYQGYNPEQFPFISQAIRDNDAQMAQIQEQYTASVVSTAAKYLAN
jgi:hypothetical protein